MIPCEQVDRFWKVFPALQRLEPQALQDLQQAASFVRLPASKVIFLEGDCATSLALVLSGTVRVFKTGKTGREITLYRIGAGESCILTVNAILNDQPYPANAVAEQVVEAVMVPQAIFRDWVRRYPWWREFAFSLLSLHLTTVLQLVDELVFRRMDSRVAAYLQQRSRQHNPVWVTHHEIAAELGSSREVISRILESFAAAGLIRATRGAVEVLDFEILEALSVG
jgi:CRP/FNR family transcriptional regulator